MIPAFLLRLNPLRNLRVLQNAENLKLIMKGGRVYKQTL